MTENVLIKNINQYIGETICIKGWVRNIRSSGKLLFIILRDGSAEVQAVAFKPELGEALFSEAKQLTIESSVEIYGIPKEHEKIPGQFELAVTGLRIIQIADDYPIGKKEHGPDFLLSQRHLWVRSRKQWALLRVRHGVYYAICDYLNDNKFIRFDTPILTPNACEGTTTLFEVPYFELGNAYLSQSGQLYLETGIMSFGRVYDFGPVFRAEKSKTRKHLTEFWMMDAEMAYVEHEENMTFQEGLIRYVVRTMIEKYGPDLEVLGRDIPRLRQADVPFKRITHQEAVGRLKQKGYDLSDTSDFGAPEEAAITEDFAVPVFIEKWPKEIKAFYMKRDPKNNDLVLGNDLIAPDGFGELIGGSQREDDYGILLGRMEKEQMPIDEYQWYLDLRKYGSVPHSGFGIGLERLIGWISGISHIREAIPFPRMIYRLKP